MDSVMSEALVRVTVSKRGMTLQDVRDWLAEIDRLHIPDTRISVLEDCLSVVFSSQILDETLSESALGVEGYDIIVGLPR
jgi:hypothetical protein